MTDLLSWMWPRGLQCLAAPPAVRRSPAQFEEAVRRRKCVEVGTVSPSMPTVSDEMITPTYFSDIGMISVIIGDRNA